VGVDLLADRVAEARRRYPELAFDVTDGERLEFGDGVFDLVLAVTLFSSVRDASMSAKVASEIDRVLKPGGGLLWYDFRYDNPRNPNVHGMTEESVRSLFPMMQGDLSSLTLLPPLSRRLGRATSLLYPALSAVPLLRSHLLGLLIKPQ
jgi:SAM-dependent methyltransferase